MSAGGYTVAVLVVSDAVSKGEQQDSSGRNLSRLLGVGDYFPVSEIFYDCVEDDLDEIQLKLKQFADAKNSNLILTVGGTGFSPRDVTPEATKAVIDREASHLASYMILSCAAETKFAVLSRSVCGIRKNSLILNLPGSKKGSEECFEVIASVLPHAMDQLIGDTVKVVDKHLEIQGQTRGRHSS